MAGKDANGGNGRGRPSSAFTGHAADDMLAVKLSDLARTLQDEESAQETLDAIVGAAVDTVPGAQHAGLTVVIRRREVETQAATGDLVQQADKAQYETGEGPCLDAAYKHRTVRLSDMTQEDRWPKFARRALDLGVRSMLSFQLYVQKGNLGALNLYSFEKNAFDDESEHVGLLFAAHAAVAMSGARQQEQLRHAIAVRDLIGQAKGVLMERHKLTADQAFSLLVRASQQTNSKLVDIAEYLVDTGELRTRGDHRQDPHGSAV
ncbi:ANTAR domain-containing protein [Microbispora sp. CA-102843]|uniref:ANTAR domain-containing protein n=1 Tax=Microbispora sp. CA-102843 TaxID=3239952 RepID=UPI003D90EF28